MEITKSGIPYTWSLVSTEGIEVILFPELNHTKHNIFQSKMELTLERDIVRMRVATLDDKIEQFWSEVFKIADKTYNLHWSQITNDYKSLRKSVLNNISPEEYVLMYLDQWKKNIKTE